MKLVVTFTYGEGYSYYQDITIPIEYPSAEDLICDIEHHCKQCLQNGIRYDDEFSNTGIFANQLMEEGIYRDPTIQTLEEWFDSAQVYVEWPTQ